MRRGAARKRRCRASCIDAERDCFLYISAILLSGTRAERLRLQNRWADLGFGGFELLTKRRNVDVRNLSPLSFILQNKIS